MWLQGPDIQPPHWDATRRHIEQPPDISTIACEWLALRYGESAANAMRLPVHAGDARIAGKASAGGLGFMVPLYHMQFDGNRFEGKLPGAWATAKVRLELGLYLLWGITGMGHHCLSCCALQTTVLGWN